MKYLYISHKHIHKLIMEAHVENKRIPWADYETYLSLHKTVAKPFLDLKSLGIMS